LWAAPSGFFLLFIFFFFSRLVHTKQKVCGLGWGSLPSHVGPPPVSRQASTHITGRHALLRLEVGALGRARQCGVPLGVLSPTHDAWSLHRPPPGGGGGNKRCIPGLARAPVVPPRGVGGDRASPPLPFQRRREILSPASRAGHRRGGYTLPPPPPPPRGGGVGGWLAVGGWGFVVAGVWVLCLVV